jgi:hypothetical protein
MLGSKLSWLLQRWCAEAVVQYLTGGTVLDWRALHRDMDSLNLCLYQVRSWMSSKLAGAAYRGRQQCCAAAAELQ